MILKGLIGGLLLVLPFQLGRHFWLSDSFLFGLKVDYLSPTLYFQDIFSLPIILLNLNFVKSLFKKRDKKFYLLITIFGGLVFLNIFFALSAQVAFFAWLRLAFLLLLGITICSQAPLVHEKITKLLPFMVVFEAALAVGQVVKQSSIGGLFWFLGERSFNLFTPGIARGSFMGEVFLRPYGTFSHPNSLAGFTLVALALILSKKKLELLDKIASLAGIGLLLLCYSRVAWFSAFLTGLTYLLLKIKRAKVDFLFLIAVFSLPLIVFLFTNTTIDPSSFWRRQALAVFALEKIKAAPLFGVGAGNFTIALSRSAKLWDWLYWLQPVHNILLLAFSELGLLALGLFFIIFKAFENLILFLRLAGSEEKRPVFGLLAALLMIIMTGFFDHYWLTLIQNQLLFVLVLSLSLAWPMVKLNHD